MASASASITSGTRELTLPTTFETTDSDVRYTITFDAQTTTRGALNPQSMFAKVEKLTADSSSVRQVTTIAVNNILFQNPQNEQRSFATLNLNQQLRVLSDTHQEKRTISLFLNNYPAYLVLKIAKADDSDDENVMYHDAQLPSETTDLSQTGAAIAFETTNELPFSPVGNSFDDPLGSLPLPDTQQFQFSIQRSNRHEPFEELPPPASPTVVQYPGSTHTSPSNHVPDVDEM